MQQTVSRQLTEHIHYRDHGWSTAIGQLVWHCFSGIDNASLIIWRREPGLKGDACQIPKTADQSMHYGKNRRQSRPERNGGVLGDIV